MDSRMQENLTIRLTKFYLFIYGFGVTKNQKLQHLLDMMLFGASGTQIFGTMLVIADMYFSWGDFYETSYALMGMVVCAVTATKFFAFFFQRKAFLKLMIDGRRNLWHGMYSEYGKTIMKKCEKQSWIFISLTAFCCHLSAMNYAIEPIIENLTRNESERLLPLHNWMKDSPIQLTPYFEIFFIGEMGCILYTTCGYICFDNFLTLLNVYIAGQFDILRNRLENIYNSSVSIKHTSNNYSEKSQKMKIESEVDKIRREFIECVKQHQLLIDFTEEVEAVYSFINLVQILLLSLLFCIVAYQLILPGNRLARRGKFLSLFIGSIIQLFTFAYSCNNVGESSSSIYDGTYYSNWNSMNSVKSGRALTRDLIIVIMRAQRPCYLTAWGFYPVDVNTLKTIATTAFSYLTLMREST